MRFKLDENLPVELAADLRFAGHDVDTVIHENLAGQPDHPVVLESAREARRILMTLDKGIVNVIPHTRDEHAGVVLFRPGSFGRLAVLDFIRSRLPQLLEQGLEHRITIVSATRIRLR